MQSTALNAEERRHVILTCYDDRIDGKVEQEAARIRAQGGRLRDKDIFRPPGGVHFLSADLDCRAAFYKYLDNCREIASATVFHFWPHTNCQECGLHRPEKLGNGTKSDLWFHVKTAKKLFRFTREHFERLPDKERPILDVRIILTIDQSIVTIDEADGLLSHVPEDIPHGLPCLHGQRPEHQHPPHPPMGGMV